MGRQAVCRKEIARLCIGERQLRPAQAIEFATRRNGRQGRERRHFPADQHQMEARRQTIDQVLNENAQFRASVGAVEIVQDQ